MGLMIQVLFLKERERINEAKKSFENNKSKSTLSQKRVVDRVIRYL